MDASEEIKKVTDLSDAEKVAAYMVGDIPTFSVVIQNYDVFLLSIKKEYDKLYDRDRTELFDFDTVQDAINEYIESDKCEICHQTVKK